MTTPDVSRRCGVIPLFRVISAEFIQWKRSSISYVSVAGLSFGLLNCLLFYLAAHEKTWKKLFAYQSLWVIFVGPLLVTLVAGCMAQIMQDCRGGGTWYRSLSPLCRRSGFFVSLVKYSLFLNALNVVPSFLILGLLFTDSAVPFG